MCVCVPTQEGFTAEDDAGASGADELRREGQDEEEEAIRQMLESARLAAEKAKQMSGEGTCMVSAHCQGAHLCKAAGSSVRICM